MIIKSRKYRFGAGLRWSVSSTKYFLYNFVTNFCRFFRTKKRLTQYWSCFIMNHVHVEWVTMPICTHFSLFFSVYRVLAIIYYYRKVLNIIERHWKTEEKVIFDLFLKVFRIYPHNLFGCALKFSEGIKSLKLCKSFWCFRLLIGVTCNLMKVFF